MTEEKNYEARSLLQTQIEALMVERAKVEKDRAAAFRKSARLRTRVEELDEGISGLRAALGSLGGPLPAAPPPKEDDESGE